MPEEADWSLTTFEGNRRRQHQQFHALPLREKLDRIEEMAEVAEHFASQRKRSGGGSSPSSHQTTSGGPDDRGSTESAVVAQARQSTIPAKAIFPFLALLLGCAALFGFFQYRSGATLELAPILESMGGVRVATYTDAGVPPTVVTLTAESAQWRQLHETLTRIGEWRRTRVRLDADDMTLWCIHIQPQGDAESQSGKEIAIDYLGFIAVRTDESGWRTRKSDQGMRVFESVRAIVDR